MVSATVSASATPRGLSRTMHVQHWEQPAPQCHDEVEHPNPDQAMTFPKDVHSRNRYLQQLYRIIGWVP